MIFCQYFPQVGVLYTVYCCAAAPKVRDEKLNLSGAPLVTKNNNKNRVALHQSNV